jgi:hypothetical protein
VGRALGAKRPRGRRERAPRGSGAREPQREAPGAGARSPPAPMCRASLRTCFPRAETAPRWPRSPIPWWAISGRARRRASRLARGPLEGGVERGERVQGGATTGRGAFMGAGAPAGVGGARGPEPRPDPAAGRGEGAPRRRPRGRLLPLAVRPGRSGPQRVAPAPVDCWPAVGPALLRSVGQGAGPSPPPPPLWRLAGGSHAGGHRGWQVAGGGARPRRPHPHPQRPLPPQPPAPPPLPGSPAPAPAAAARTCRRQGPGTARRRPAAPPPCGRAAVGGHRGGAAGARPGRPAARRARGPPRRHSRAIRMCDVGKHHREDRGALFSLHPCARGPPHRPARPPSPPAPAPRGQSVNASGSLTPRQRS